MSDYRALDRSFAEELQLNRPPVAIAFLDAPPSGVMKFTGVVPSGCSFWRLAAEGQTFFTVPADHYNCPIGSYTHNVPLPPDRASELESTLSLMAGIGYVRMEEVSGIPRLATTPGAIVYAPLADTPVPPDVVMFTVSAQSMMILGEAATRARVASGMSTIGRPTCMAIPASLMAGVVASTGCIGNRVYTGIEDNELYVAVPGKDLEAIATELKTIATANATLREYHSNRREALTV
jgi:uncharacterized protein (DUF169 family)